MRVLRHYTDLPSDARGGVVAIGNFDGVHHGHRAVIAEAVASARAEGCPAAVLTFEPHPRSFFNPGAPPFRLTTLRSKAHQVESLGVDLLFAVKFDADLAALSPEGFVEQVLREGLGARRVVVGYDFVFGHRRAGDRATLERLAAAAGIGVTVVEAVANQGTVYSSSRIRQALEEGDPRRAAALLGHWWEIEGRVQGGDRRGRGLGYPTANLGLDDYLRPALGIYAVRAGLEETGRLVWRDAVASLGRRPTFGGGDILLEVHLFDFSGDLYGRHLRAAFIDYIRAEKKFDDVEALKREMDSDSRIARRILADEKAAGATPETAMPGRMQQVRS